MKIGFFSDSYFPEIDGVTYTLKSWKERLEERGHEVYIIYPESSEYEPGENEIPVYSVSNPFYQGYNIPLPTRKEMPDLDIVHCHTPVTLGIRGLIYAKTNNIPAIYTHHTPLEKYFDQNLPSKKLSHLLGKFYVPIESWLLRRFDEVTSNTGEINRNVEVERLPAGIDTSFFQPTEESFEFDDPTIGYSGRISMEKNVVDICELAEKMPEANFVIVGEGPRRDIVEKKAPDNVEINGFLDREDLPKYYSSIDVFLTASTGDTLGLSTLESNACGTPVVAPDTYPFNNTIKKENGLRFKIGDTLDMEDKVEKALEQERDTRSAVKNYSMECSIDQLLKLYESVEGSKDD